MREKFDPLDLEIVDRVYGVACAYIEARDLYRDEKDDAEEEEALRIAVFAQADAGPLDFDILCDKLCDKVLAKIDKLRFRRAA